MHVVLDLDETLVSVTNDPYKHRMYDGTFAIDGTTFYLKKRPYLDQFLAYLFDNFASVSVFTAAMEDYARQVVSMIMSKAQAHKLLFVWSRNHLRVGKVPGGYTKRLADMFAVAKKRGVNMTRHNTVIVDDRFPSMQDNVGNAVIIPAFIGSQMDRELVKLILVFRGLIALSTKHPVNMGSHKHALFLAQISAPA